MLCMVFALAACGTGAPDNSTPAKTVSGESKHISGTGNETRPETTTEATTGADSGSDSKEPSEPDSKILIAYFSRADENYGVGVIEKGNTELIAEMIAEETGGELFHIERNTHYPAEYRACTDEAKKEQNDSARPALKETKDISDYDAIYLGYPNWWGDMPMPVYTFIESQNWNGKTVIPFCTHAGSGLSGTVNTLKNVCSGATVLDGLAIQGTTAQNDRDAANKAVTEWLSTLGQ